MHSLITSGPRNFEKGESHNPTIYLDFSVLRAIPGEKVFSGARQGVPPPLDPPSVPDRYLVDAVVSSCHKALFIFLPPKPPIFHGKGPLNLFLQTRARQGHID